MRIITLIASATEIVCGLGAETCLVARSHECDNPASVKSLPVITAPKFSIEGSSADIDARVREIVADGLSVYRVDAAALAALAPDVIVTQDQCEVCAVSLADVERAVRDCAGTQARIVSLKPFSLADVYADIGKVASAIGREAQGHSLVQRMQDRIGGVLTQTRNVSERPRLAFIEWIDPLMSGGHWTPELIAAAGGVSLFGAPGKKSERLTWDAIRQADPDVIVVAPCGFDIERTRVEMPVLEALPGWPELAAVRHGRVHIADGNLYFNRPGPGLAETTEILAEMLFPDRVAYGHRDRSWITHTAVAAADRPIDSTRNLAAVI